MIRVSLFALVVAVAAPMSDAHAGLFRKRSKNCCQPAPACCDAGSAVPMPNPPPPPPPNPKPNPEPTPKPKVASIDADAWKNFSNDAGRFSVQFPGTAKETVQKINNISNYVYSASAGGAEFAVSYFDLPANVALTLDTSVSAYSKGVGGTIVSDQRTTVNDEYPARKVTINTAKSTHQMLIFFVKNRQYQVIVNGAVADKDAKKFFDSFKLK
jgi:hypothetical protein